MDQIPTIRFEIEGMRHAILTHINTYHKDVENYLDKETKKFVEGYDFQAAVAKCLGPVFDDAIRKALESHFTYGPGRDAIEKAVAEMMPSKKEK